MGSSHRRHESHADPLLETLRKDFPRIMPRPLAISAQVLGSGTAAMFSAAAFLSFPGIVERKMGLDCPGTRNCAPVAGRKKECERRFRVRVCPCMITVVP